MSGREFVCDVTPEGDGRWLITIREAQYLGIATDVALGRWNVPKRGTSASPRAVGRYWTAWGARRAARRAIRKAEHAAWTDAVENREWRRNLDRKGFTVTRAGERHA